MTRRFNISLNLKNAFALFMLLVVMLTSLLSIYSYKVYAEELDIGDNEIFDLNDGTGDKDEKEGANILTNATVIEFVDRSRIKVTVNVDKQLFKDPSKYTDITYREAYSGTYYDSNIIDDTNEWKLQNPKTIRNNELSIYAFIKIRDDPRYKLPEFGASDADLEKFFKSENNKDDGIMMYLGVSDKRGNTDNDKKFYYVDRKDDGEGFMWQELSTSKYDWGYGVGKRMGEDPKKYEFRNVRFTYSNQTINAIQKPRNESAQYVFCDNNFTKIKYYFKGTTCDGGDTELFIKTWEGLSSEEILAQMEGDSIIQLFQGDANTGDYIIDGNGTVASRLVAQGNTEAAETNPLDDDTGGIQDIELNCNFGIFNPLRYIMCPLIEGAARSIGVLDNEIRKHMTIDVGLGSDYDETRQGTDSGKALYKAWASVRTIALSVLVIAALVMVISQALSIGPFDAYTVKKVLPRIVAASILITLSWQITKLGIQMSNIAGNGLGVLISAPFRDLGDASISSIGGTAGLVGLGSAVFLSGVDLLVVMSLALTGLAAVLIGFLTMTFREIMLMLLAITSPLAFAFWILPNTQKAWSFWKTTLYGALLAYPIIVAFIYGGRVFAVISSNSSDGESIFRDITTFLAYFGPYFAIPAAFRLAGGAIAQIGGIVNDKSKGFFDGQKKFRGQRKSMRKQEMRIGQRWQGRSWIPGSTAAANRVNRMTRGASTGLKGNFGLGQRGLAARTNNVLAAADELAANDKAKLLANDDNARAATFNNREDAINGTEAAIRRKLERDNVRTGRMTSQQADAEARRRAVAAANNVEQSLGGFGAASQVAGFRALATNGTGLIDMEDQIETMARVVRQTGLGDGAAGSLAAHANSAAGAQRRHDLAASQGTLYNAAVRQAGINGQTPLEVGTSEYNTMIRNAMGDAQGATDVMTQWRDRGTGFQQQISRHQSEYQQAETDYRDASLAYTLAQNAGDTIGMADAQARMNSAVVAAQEAETMFTKLEDYSAYGTVENQDHFDDAKRAIEGSRQWLGRMNVGDTRTVTDASTGAQRVIPVSALDAARARVPRGPSPEELQRRGLGNP